MNAARESTPRDACEALSHAYAEYADGWQSAKFAELFTPDGVFSRLGKPIAGRQAIADYMENRPRDVWQKHRNSNFQFQLAPDGRSASGTLDVDMDKGKVGDTAVQEVLRAHYKDQFVLTDEGWRFRLREVSLRA